MQTQELTPVLLCATVALSDDSGSVTTRYTYGPFGETSATGATSGNPFQFTGRENDGTGLYYYRARYYSPSRSRFLSEDPIGFDAGDPNLYAYVLNSPTNLVDPSGEAGRIPPFVKKCVVGLIKAIAKIAGADLAKRKPDIDPDDLLDAAKGCGGGGGNKASGNSAKGAGQQRTNKLGPNPDAGGPHTQFKTDPKTGKVTGYTEFDAAGNPVKRFRGEGKPHGGTEPPFILEPKEGKGPGALPKVPRPPRPDELPKGY